MRISKLNAITSFRVHLDVGLAEKYTDYYGGHKASEKINEFVGDMVYASRAAMNNMTQSRRDDIESLYFVLTCLAGFTSPFEKKKFKDLLKRKEQFCTHLLNIVRDIYN